MSAIKSYETQCILNTKAKVARDLQILKSLIEHQDPEIVKLVKTWLFSDYTVWASVLGLSSQHLPLPYKGWYDVLAQDPIEFLRYLVCSLTSARYPGILYMKVDEESWEYIQASKDDFGAKPYIIKDKYAFQETHNAEILTVSNCIEILDLYNKKLESHAEVFPEDAYAKSYLYGQNTNARLWGPIIKELSS
jgi:hypothetical protein